MEDNEATREVIPTVDDSKMLNMMQSFIKKIVVNMDEDLVVCSELMDVEIVADVLKKKMVNLLMKKGTTNQNLRHFVEGHHYRC